MFTLFIGRGGCRRSKLSCLHSLLEAAGEDGRPLVGVGAGDDG